MRLPRWVVGVVLASLFFGVVVRLVWPDDMEWKGDEIYSVVEAQKILETHEWPATGMGTSVALPNPGLSLWAFVPLVAVAKTPIGVCVGVMLLNTAALLGFAVLAALGGGRGPAAAAEGRRPLGARLAERESWLWAVSLMAVNPYVVRLSRKIWPPSLLSPLILLLYVGRARRQTRLGAFVWGLAGAAMGQIHLSGFFLAGGVFLKTLVDRWRARDDVATRWAWWLAGSCCGGVGLISWYLILRLSGARSRDASLSVAGLYQSATDFYRLWGELAVGHTAWFSYTMDLGHLLSLPKVAGVPTHLVGWLYDLLYWIALLAIGIWAVNGLTVALPGRWARRLALTVRQHRRRKLALVPAPWRSIVRRAWLLMHQLLVPRINQPIGCDVESRFYSNATALWGAGLTILTCRIVRIHYVYAFIPFVFVWLANVCARRRRLLAVVLAIQAALTLAILLDVHARGTVHGDYGQTYRTQMRDRDATAGPNP